MFYGGLIAALVMAFVYMRPQAPAAAGDRGRLRAGHRARPRHRTPGLFRGRLLLGRPHATCPGPSPSPIPEANRLVGVPLGIPLHPTQLYEALGGVRHLRDSLPPLSRRPHRPGAIISLYLMLYSTVRFLVEFVRAHDKANFHVGPLVVEQWIALGLFALGLFLVRRGALAAPVKTAKVR